MRGERVRRAREILPVLGHLHAGIDTDHATLGATVETAKDDEFGYRMIVRSVLDN